MAKIEGRGFTDLFIHRPVLSTVLSLLILLIGLQAAMKLSVRQFPELTKTTITISTSYPGADADLMLGFITTPLQQAVASTEGIDTISSSSTQEQSRITLNLRLDADGDRALTEVLTKINQVRNILPREANDPIVTKSTGDDFALMYIDFRTDKMTPTQVTDYLARVVQPALQSIEGVGSADILGGQNFAMRLWLDPGRMAATGVTALDVNEALRDNNFVSAAGQIKSDFIQIGVQANTDLTTPDAFASLIVATRGDTLIRLRDIAEVELGPQGANSASYSNGKKAVFIGINVAPGANPLAVSDRVHAAFPDIKSQYPAGLDSDIGYDASKYIRGSINEVIKTIAEAAVIVIVVIFLFLGNIRSTLIPMVTIPLSLVGVMVVLSALGYSINLLTLLALVMAIGLVVDDAIVVTENIHRHIEKGEAPLDAALLGAREITLPIVAMTITLAAVYAPIGFIGGLTGILFREFAFTLAGAVIVSGIIALTLSPMMASRFLKAEDAGKHSGVAHFLDRLMIAGRGRYERALEGVMRFRPVVIVWAVGLAAFSGLMFAGAQRELAPPEDSGEIFQGLRGPQTANLDYMIEYAERLEPIYTSFPEAAGSFMVVGFGGGGVATGFAGMSLTPWDERDRDAAAIVEELQPKLDAISGIQVFAFNLPPLPGTSGGPPIQFTIKTTADYEALFGVIDELQQKARESGIFLFTDTNLRFDTPQIRVDIDHLKANQLGISMADIGTSLATLLGGNYVNRFSLLGRSYQVIPQVPREFRINEDWINRYQVRTNNGQLVPLSTVITISHQVRPNALTTFQQQNSATFQGSPFPGRTMGEALDFLTDAAETILPPGYGYDFQGESRQYVQEGSTLVATFGFSLIIIFLVLAAQFESWRDPLIILVAVPLSVFGALLPITFGFATINIYTQIGFVTLIGLISKHGILMVEFANRLQRNEGLDRRAAIIRAAGVRMRPILMTTAAMVMGVVPLLVASGAGAASRSHIGAVIASGMMIGTLFTLFVVPVVYSYLSGHHRAAESSTQDSLEDSR